MNPDLTAPHANTAPASPAGYIGATSSVRKSSAKA